MNAVTIIGFFGSVTSCMMFIPDAIRVFKLRHDVHALAGVSLYAKGFAMVNSVLWITYAVLINAFWLGLPSSINIFVNTITVFIVTQSRRSHPKEAAEYEPQESLL